MTDALDRLLDRSHGTAPTVTPRLPGQFEPSAREREAEQTTDGFREADVVLEATASQRPAAASPRRVEPSFASPDNAPDAEPFRDTRGPRSAEWVDANAGRLEDTRPPATEAYPVPNPPAPPMPSTAPPEVQYPSEPASRPALPAAEPAPRHIRPAAAAELPAANRRWAAVPQPQPQPRHAQHALQRLSEPASRPALPAAEPAPRHIRAAAAAELPAPSPPSAATPQPQPRHDQRAPQPPTLLELTGAEQRIEVHIGRIEVRMHSPAPAQQRLQRSVPREPPVSLDEYLHRRRKG